MKLKIRDRLDFKLKSYSKGNNASGLGGLYCHLVSNFIMDAGLERGDSCAVWNRLKGKK